MDDNQFATSEDSFNSDSAAAPETLDTPSADSAPVAAPVEAPAEPPKSTREALEQAFKQAQDKEAGVAPTAPAAAATDPTKPAIEPAPSPKAVKAPQSWKPDVRGQFDTLPDAVKNEVTRRENEITATLAKTANERRLASEFIQAAQPYEAMYRSRGLDPLRAAQQLFNADYVLQHGNAQQKVQLVGGLLKGWSQSDLAALDSHLAGVQPSQAAPAAQQDPALLDRLQRIEQYALHQQQQAHQQSQASLNSQIETFANDSKNEYFNDVAPHMVALLQGGAVSTLKDAYDQACYANPAVRKALMDRQAANAARLNASGASLPNKGPRNGTQSAAPVIKDRRAALEAAFAEAERGRV